MAAPSPSFTVTFVQAVGGAMLVRVTDTTDWAGSGISLADVEISVGIKAPNGITIHPAQVLLPDIFPATTRIFEWPAPVDVAGKPMTGDYKVWTVSVVTGSAFPGTYDTGEITHNLCADYPALELTTYQDCFSMYVAFTDTTAWVANGFTVDSRLLTITYPGAPPIRGPITSTTDTVTTLGSQFSSGTYSISALWTVHKGNYTATFRLEQSYTPTCAQYNLCDLLCCLEGMRGKIRNSDYGTGDIHFQKWQRMCAILQSMQMAAMCGNGVLLGILNGQFNELGGCTTNPGGCGCTPDGTPRILVPLHPVGGQSVTAITVAAGVGIDVTYNSNTSTYTVSLDAATQAALANIFTYSVISSGGTVTVGTTNPTPGSVLFDLAVAKPPKDSMKVAWYNDLVTGGQAWGIRSMIGTTFKEPTINTFLNSWYRINDFFTGSPVRFSVTVTLEEMTATSTYSAYSPTRYSPLAVPQIMGIDVTEAIMGIVTNHDIFGVSNGTSFNLAWYTPYLRKYDVIFTFTAL